MAIACDLIDNEFMDDLKKSLKHSLKAVDAAEQAAQENGK